MSIERTVENVYLRHDAVTLTRKHFWRLLGMLLLIMLCTWLLDTGLTALGDAITSQETATVISAITTYANSPTLTATDPVADAVTDLITSPKYFLFNLVYVVITGLVTTGLGLGRHAQVLAAARDEKPRVLGCFCRMRYCFKAWRLSLWIAIKVALWAMPGLLCIVVGAELGIYDQTALGNLIIMAGIGVLIALTIRAGLRYCLATFILADEPDRGVRECVTLSKGLMQDRLWQCFKLGVPTILKMISVMYGSMLVLSIPVVIVAAIGNPSVVVAGIFLVLMLLVITLPALYFSLQFDMVYACFYLKRRIPADQSTSYWLRDHEADTTEKAAPVSYWLRDPTVADIAPAEPDAPESPDLPEESPVNSPEDRDPENTEEKEKTNEEPVC